MRIPTLGDGIDEINVVPINAINLVDIFFNLLIFFMVLGRLETTAYELETNLPKVSSANQAGEDTTLRIAIDENGVRKINNDQLTLKEIAKKLDELASRKAPPTPSVLVLAHKKADWGDVAEILGLCHQKNITNARAAVILDQDGRGGGQR